MSKEINCSFQMGGTYYLEERSVLAARRKAMENLSLPEDRDYLDDSLEVDNLNECMVANGWSNREVDELSGLSAEALNQMIDTRIKTGAETVPGSSYTTTRLKEFLLDYYDILYPGFQPDDAKSAEVPAETPQPAQDDSYAEKPCCIVIQTDYETGTFAYAYDTEETAMKSVNADVEAVKKNPTNSGYEFKMTTNPIGEIELTKSGVKPLPLGMGI